MVKLSKESGKLSDMWQEVVEIYARFFFNFVFPYLLFVLSENQINSSN